MNAAIVCFGELLLRLSAPRRELLLQSARLDVHFGGAEANVRGLARLGHDTAMITASRITRSAEAASAYLRRYDVDASAWRPAGAM